MNTRRFTGLTAVVLGIWLGLAGYPEGETFSGGLALYDIKNKIFKKYNIPPVINAIYKFDNDLY